jgi:hypothetical protein
VTEGPRLPAARQGRADLLAPFVVDTRRRRQLEIELLHQELSRLVRGGPRDRVLRAEKFWHHAAQPHA